MVGGGVDSRVKEGKIRAGHGTVWYNWEMVCSSGRDKGRPEGYA